MQIKGADGREADLAALRGLLDRPDVDASTRARIEREVRTIAAGATGERDAAYEIEFHFGKLEKRATINDLRLDVDGRVAQIDHLIIDRLLTIWVCESKHFAEGVGVNDHGEWVRCWPNAIKWRTGPRVGRPGNAPTTRVTLATGPR